MRGMKISVSENTRNETKRSRRRRLVKLALYEKARNEDKRCKRRRGMEISASYYSAKWTKLCLTFFYNGPNWKIV